jgi:hypothetical protein
MKRLGPELKMPKLKKSDLKLPPVLVDLYWDLWDRRLLPLIALVVVAIAAVPFLLGGGSEESPAPPAPPATPGTVGGFAANASSSSSALTVVQAEPGLRDYRRRLGRRSPTDPFKQHHANPASVAHLNPMPTTTTTTAKSSSGGSVTVTSTSGTDSAPETAPAGPPSEGGEEHSGGGAPSGGGGESHVTLFAFAIDVKITRMEPENGGRAGSQRAVGSDSSKETGPEVKHGVLPLTPLPGEKVPVVTYMGPSKKGKPLLLVSRDVRSIFGEGKCLEGDEICQLLEVEPGFPVTFAYGANEVRYRINVLKIELVVTGHS